MSNYGTMLRPTAAAATRVAEETPNHARSTAKSITKLVPHPQAFDVPTDAETAAVRVVRNISYFRFYYTLFLWVVLAISLIPQRRKSLILLAATTAIGLAVQILPRVFPGLAGTVHWGIGRRLVAAAVVVAIVVEMVVTDALKHLLITQGICMAIVLVHAVFRVGDDLFVSQEAMAAGELVPLIETKDKDVEAAS